MSDSFPRYVVDSKCTCLAAGSQDLWRHAKDCPVVVPVSHDQTPVGKQRQPHDDWNGNFYETPTTSEHRFWNGGYEKAKASLEADLITTRAVAANYGKAAADLAQQLEARDSRIRELEAEVQRLEDAKSTTR